MSTERRPTIAQEALDAVAAPTSIRAILIDPRDCSASYIDLPLLPAMLGCTGSQLAPDRLASLLGKTVAQHELTDSEVLLVGSTGPTWYLGFDGPHRGPGVLVAYDRPSDSYADTIWTLAQITELIVPGETGEDDEEENSDAAAAA